MLEIREAGGTFFARRQQVVVRDGKAKEAGVRVEASLQHGHLLAGCRQATAVVAHRPRELAAVLRMLGAISELPTRGLFKLDEAGRGRPRPRH